MFNFLKKFSDPNLVILGHQKSGTSAIANLIAEATGMTRQIDIPITWPPNFEKLISGQVSLRELYTQSKSSFHKQIVKEPNLTFIFDQLDEIFTNTTYVFILRNPLSNIRSILNRYSIPGDLTRFHPENYEIENHHAMFNPEIYGLKNCNYVEVIAHRWNICYDVYDNNKDRFVLLKYEDFLRDKIEFIHGFCLKARLKKKNDIVKIVDKQFQPKGDNSKKLSDFFGENYGKVITRCADRAGLAGYNLKC